MKWYLFLILLFIVGCSSVSKEPILVLEANSIEGNAPLQVDFVLKAENVECGDILWDWGDGNYFSQDVDCSEKVFESVNIYDKEGEYIVSAKIGDLKSNEIVIKVKPKEKRFMIESECRDDNDCITGGCSGEICVSRLKDTPYSTCEYKPEYDCYELISCGCEEGECKWRENEDFEWCVKSKG